MDSEIICVKEKKGKSFRYLSDRKREATITDVKFITDDKIVYASFLDCYLVLYRSSDKVILSKIYTYVKKRKAEVDLISICNGKIYVSHIYQECIGIYALNGDKIEYVDMIQTKHGRPHGIFVRENEMLYTTVNTYSVVKNGNVVYKHDQSSSMQSVALFKKYIICVGTYLGVDTNATPGAVKSYIVIINIDDNSNSHFDVINVRYDGLCVNNDKLYVCDQYNSKIDIYCIDPNAVITKSGEIHGMSFCHGCDVFNGKIAVACYGTNSIKITQLPPD